MGNRELPGKPDEMVWSLSPSTRVYKYVTENCLGNLMKWRGVGFIPLDLGVQMGNIKYGIEITYPYLPLRCSHFHDCQDVSSNLRFVCELHGNSEAPSVRLERE